MKVRVLLADDEPQLLRTVRTHLSADRFDVLCVADAAQAVVAAARLAPELIIVNVGPADEDAVAAIAELRRWTKAPILVHSRRGYAHESVDVLDAGADDYVAAPVSQDELMARIRALLRRAEAEPALEVAIVGHHRIDLAAKTVERTEGAPAGVPARVHLTKTEWAVLEVLLRNPGRLVSGRQLLQQVWGPGHESEANYLRFHMAKLRGKLEPVPSRPQQLVTELGMGYRFLP